MTGWRYDYDSNPYSSPQNVGLEIIGTLDASEAYEFDILLVVRDTATGRVYLDTDSGCSCPAPFENVNSLSDMQEIRSVEDYRAAARTWNSNNSVPATEVRALEMKVADALLSIVPAR